MRQKRAHALIAVLLLASLFLLASCGPTAPELTPQSAATTPSIVVDGTLLPNATPTVTPMLAATPTPTPIPTATYFEQDPDADPPADYKGLIGQFDIILVGQFTKELREDNVNRSYEDMSKPDPNFWYGVKVYDFRIDSVLKGKIKDKAIEVALEYYDQNTKAGTAKVYNERFIEPELNQTYVIGLFYDPDIKWYINDQGVEPQRFKVTDNMLVFDSKQKSAVDVWGKVDPITLDAFKKLFK